MRLNPDMSRAQAASKAARGFTLIEILLVIAIMGIFLAVGVPSVLRSMQRNDLTTASQNIMEGCAYAREMAILRGVPYEFVINADRTMTVEPARNWQSATARAPGAAEGSLASQSQASARNPTAGFKRTLTDTVLIDAIAINFVDLNQTDTDQARVRFHANGTSDEFTILLNSKEGMRKITLDIVTGKPDMLAVR